MVTEDPREVVRRGYDALSVRYDEEYGGETKYRAWLGELRERIPAGGKVLDLGCGSGIPVARDLSEAGYRVTGIDISEVQIRRARELVPRAEFVRADITTAELDLGSFDSKSHVQRPAGRPSLPPQPGHRAWRGYGPAGNQPGAALSHSALADQSESLQGSRERADHPRETPKGDQTDVVGDGLLPWPGVDHAA